MLVHGGCREIRKAAFAHALLGLLATAGALAPLFAQAAPPSAIPVRASLGPTSRILYVSPGGGRGDGGEHPCTRQQPCSLTEAQQRVREILRIGGGRHRDLVVELAGGTYRLQAPLRFAAPDSGRDGNPVLWTAAPSAHAVISGGTRVRGWVESDPAQGIWSARVPADTRSLQLYVDGKEAQLAQASTKSLGLKLADWSSKGFVTSGATAAYFSHLAAAIGPANVKRLELVWAPMPPTDWEESECPVAAIGPATITMAQPCWKNLTHRPATIWGAGNKANVNPYELKAGSAPTTIVNAYPLLTEPGQWYLDTDANTLYYKPAAGQNMAKVDVEIPRLQSLLQLNGTLAHPVKNLTFRGLTFSTSTWLQPVTSIGFVQVQDNLLITRSDNQGECTFTSPAGSCPWAGFSQPPAAVQLTAARHIRFEDDTFADLGSVGMAIRYGSDDNLVRGNTFAQIASSAIWLGCAGDPDPADAAADPVASILSLCATGAASATDRELAASPAEIMTGNTVDNNVIHHAGYGYLGAAGITMLFTQHTTISHNDIFDLPYDGLSSGAWQGHPDDEAIGPTHNRDVTTNINSGNAIRDNYFHNNMEVFTGDGGDIYTEGHQGITVRDAYGAVDAARSYAGALKIHGNLFDADPRGNHAYAIAPDVGSQWIEATGNAEWGLRYSFSCHWPSNLGSELVFTENWRANPDDGKCPTDFGNTKIASGPGPADIPLSVLANAGVQGRYQALEAALPAKLDYSGVSPASGDRPAEVLVTGSGFTRSTTVFIGGVASPHVQFVSPGVLVAAVPPGVPDTAPVTVQNVTVQNRTRTIRP